MSNDKTTKSIVDEFNDNFETTMKKFNDVELSRSLSIIESVGDRERNETSRNLRNDYYNHENLQNNYFSYTNINKGKTMATTTSSIDEDPCEFPLNYSKFMKSLNDLECKMKNDFEQIENTIENILENEIKSLKSLQ